MLLSRSAAVSETFTSNLSRKYPQNMLPMLIVAWCLVVLVRGSNVGKGCYDSSFDKGVKEVR